MGAAAGSSCSLAEAGAALSVGSAHGSKAADFPTVSREAGVDESRRVAGAAELLGQAWESRRGARVSSAKAWASA